MDFRQWNPYISICRKGSMVHVYIHMDSNKLKNHRSYLFWVGMGMRRTWARLIWVRACVHLVFLIPCLACLCYWLPWASLFSKLSARLQPQSDLCYWMKHIYVRKSSPTVSLQGVTCNETTFFTIRLIWDLLKDPLINPIANLIMQKCFIAWKPCRSLVPIHPIFEFII